MTSAALTRPQALVAVGAAGCAALLVRPWVLPHAGDPGTVLLAGFVALLAVGVMWPVPASVEVRAGARAVSVALAFGVGAFVAGRIVAPGTAMPFVAGAVARNALAAIAEEAFFRRLLFGALRPHGATVAVVGSALAFALVHVTVWGSGVLALDFAAGLVLSWQRMVSGRWTVPAATHVVANVLAAV